MTTDTPLLLALGLFAFYSALGDILKATAAHASPGGDRF